MERHVRTILVSILLLVCSYHTIECLRLDSPKQDRSSSAAPSESSSSSISEAQDLVHVLESGQPIRWSGVKQLSQLAPESQVVSVLFALHHNGHQLSSGGKLDSRSSNSNKTKQSQDFDTHQKPSTDSGLTASTTVASTQPEVTPEPTPSPPSVTSQIVPVSIETTSEHSSTSEQAVSTAATTTTSAVPATTESDSGWPQRPSSTEQPPGPVPVGSSVVRQGEAVLCGEANANGKSNKRLLSDRIVGGHKTEPGEFPFQVRLNIRSRRGSGICGGVVLDGHHILTAAHCMTACVSQHLTTATIESSGVKATVGDHSIKSNDGEQELDVETITPHERYDACNFYSNDHDIALIKTVQPIEYRFTTDGYGSINRPCMPKRNDAVYSDGDQVIVSGWGVTRENSGALSNILRYVQVPVVNVSRCQETYGTRVTQDHVCAGYQVGGKDSCQGDSGGPLVRVVDNRYELVGIVSFGYGCGQPSAPGVYTRVASYLDWIKANL